MLQPFLGGVLLLTLGFLQFSQAQETSSKPEAPTPKKIEAPIPRPHNSSAHCAVRETHHRTGIGCAPFGLRNIGRSVYFRRGLACKILHYPGYEFHLARREYLGLRDGSRGPTLQYVGWQRVSTQGD